MAKKSSKSRRREGPAIDAVGSAIEPAVVSLAGDSARVDAAAVFSEPSTQVVPVTPSLPKLSPETLAALDSFVRSPAAVVESLGIRVATAVARKLASTPPPVSIATEELVEA